MKKFKSVLSRLLILALMISSFAILGCPNPNDANPDVGGGTDQPAPQPQGPKLIIHWVYPDDTKPTTQEIYADENGEAKLPSVKDIGTFSLLGYTKTKPNADTKDADHYAGEKVSLTEDVEFYVLWEDNSITLTFHYTTFDSRNDEHETKQIKVKNKYSKFDFLAVDKENETEVCNTWTDHEGYYEANSNQKDVYVDDYILTKYDENCNAIVNYYDFYELWYKKENARKFYFNKNDCESSSELEDCETKTIYAYIGKDFPKEVDPYSFFTREGYTLVSFNEDATYTFETKYNSFEKNKTYYAIWKKDNGYITNYVSDSSWRRVESDTADTRLADDQIITRTNERIGGWKRLNNSVNRADYLPNEKIQFSDPIDTYYAVWQAESEFEPIEISFYSDEDKTEEIKYEAAKYPIEVRISTDLNLEHYAMVLPECEFEKEGYTFVGWKNRYFTYQPGKCVKDFYYRDNEESKYFIAQWEKN